MKFALRMEERLGREGAWEATSTCKHVSEPMTARCKVSQSGGEHFLVSALSALHRSNTNPWTLSSESKRNGSRHTNAKSGNNHDMQKMLH
jgi:hypothetical protein